MTDRINALTVVFEKEIRDDDVQQTIDAILQIKNVLSVDMNVADAGSYIAHETAKSVIRKKLFEVLKD